jgi:ACS family tartrate transporter-like MFS transporter
MNRALAITSQQFGFLAGIFFLGYFFFEIPSNLLLHKLGARVWIARILVSWGAGFCPGADLQSATAADRSAPRAQRRSRRRLPM